MPVGDSASASFRSQASALTPSSSTHCCPRLVQGRPLTAIVSSRLGKPVERYEEWFTRLELQAFRARERDHSLILVEGTTTFPWLKQAAELYGIPAVMLHPTHGEDRDTLAITAADRVVALHVRPQGNIYRGLQERLLASPNQTDVWVSIDVDTSPAIRQLMDLGAVGWYRNTDPHFVNSKGFPATEIFPASMDAKSGNRPESLPFLKSEKLVDASEWFVHCTRGRSGPLPGQTEEAWRREVLLGGRAGRAWSAADVLEEIVRGRLLRGNPQTKNGEPVVCFSAVPLADLLGRRTYRSHRGRWDYEPYGIAIRKRALEAAGAMPVEYREESSLRKLRQGKGEASHDLWRMQPRGKTFDWREEKEWRIRGSVDLEQFSDEDVFIFSAEVDCANRLNQISPWPVLLVNPSRTAQPK